MPAINDPNVLLIVIDLVLLGLAIQILFLLSLRNAVAQCAPQNRALSPGQVWLFLIPLFNLVWQFLMTARIDDTLRREFAARQLPPPSPEATYGRGVGLAACILSVTSFIPILGLVTGPASGVCWIIYWVKIAGFATILEKNAPSAADFSPAYPQPASVRDATTGWLVLLVLVIGAASGVLPAILRSLSLAAMSEDLRASTRDFTLMFDVAAVSLAAGAVIMSIVAAVGGARRAFLISLVGIALATAAGGLVSDLAGLIVTSLLTSFFAGGLLPSAILAVRQWMAPGIRAFAIGLFFAARQLPNLVTGAVLSALMKQVSWRMMMFAGSIPAVIAVILCALIWTSPPPRMPSRNWSGSSAAVWMLGAGMLLAAPVLWFLNSGVRAYAQMGLGVGFEQVGSSNAVSGAAGFFGAVLAGVIASALQSATMTAARVRAMLLTLCGLVLPLAAVITHVAAWPLVLLLVALCSAAYYAWVTLLHSAVADTVSLAAVAVVAALGAVSANLGGAISSQVLNTESFATLAGIAGATGTLALIIVALTAWLSRTEPAA